MLRGRIDVRQVRNTGMIEIHVSSQDRHEAAQLANAIADRYMRVRGEGVVEIVDRAEPAPRASRPNRLLGLFVGAVLAVLLGLVASGLTLILATRRRFRDLVKAEIAQTVQDPADVGSPSPRFQPLFV